ncbi:hypothetical protein Gotri_025481, partial [Gossypium trilobum]|nr:hypothetical protein [Gossypium trilobum]
MLQFQSMRMALANVWHALDGVLISDLKEKHLFFWVRIYCKYHCFLLIFLVQIVDSPSGLVSKLMSKQFRNFIG